MKGAKGEEITVLTPSKTLTELIDSLALDFGKLKQRVEKVFEQGREEGFQDSEIGKMVRARMAEHYTRQTITNVLPETAKSKPRGDPQGPFSKKTLLTGEKVDGEESDFPRTLTTPQFVQELAEIPEREETSSWQIKPADYNIADIEQYDRGFLVKLVEYLHSQVKTLKRHNSILAVELEDFKQNPKEYVSFEGKKSK